MVNSYFRAFVHSCFFYHKVHKGFAQRTQIFNSQFSILNYFSFQRFFYYSKIR